MQRRAGSGPWGRGLHGSKPLLDIIEPQIATVNEYALKGLDKMEEKLPILHQPADKVVSDTVGLVYQSVAGAKDAVLGAAMGGVEMTWAAFSGGLMTAMGTRMGQMVSSGMGLALSRSEDWVEQNLPLAETELAAVAEPASSEGPCQPPPQLLCPLGETLSQSPGASPAALPGPGTTCQGCHLFYSGSDYQYSGPARDCSHRSGYRQ
ncbi:hypothetical protein F7725_027474 [Dissostichus mawsoni]|uniref:Uncharacterized protein n=1 Tax=Dissostichus mawsoni TaxID=36200 RepID=A0A7J5XD07_DISMA|nr:hypothetical protein F7725_027474 [Dissostichus mawsoni]